MMLSTVSEGLQEELPGCRQRHKRRHSRETRAVDGYNREWYVSVGHLDFLLRRGAGQNRGRTSGGRERPNKEHCACGTHKGPRSTRAPLKV